MGKSNYPKRYAASAKALAYTGKLVKADSAMFKKLTKAFADGATVTRALPVNYRKIHQMQTNEMDAYFIAVSMIVDLENQMNEAKDDKKKQSELKKKLAAEEKKAAAYVQALNTVRDGYGEIRAIAQAQITAVQGIYDSLHHEL